MTENLSALRQSWDEPSSKRPIVVFGAGSIVGDAHLPAYENAGFEVSGIYDPDTAKAEALAEQHGCRVFDSIAAAVADRDVIFDLATPPAHHLSVLEHLPEGAITLIQKPMGNDLAEATAIVQCCRRRQLQAAVNFQLRFAPMSLALQSAIGQGLLGEVIDVDAWIAVETPWHLFDFVKTAKRVEISLHSIHYLDLIRSLLGDPQGVHARTMGHPAHTIAQTRTSAILDYGDRIRCQLSVNHDHAYGRRFQASEFRISGTQGAAWMKLGVILDYPRGEPDELWIHTGGKDWQAVELDGTWFPDAFIGRMQQVQRFAAGDEDTLVSPVEDAWRTMALVEAAYTSSSCPATPIDTLT